MSIASGDTVTLTCMSAALPGDLIADASRVRADHRLAMHSLSSGRGIGPHMMTGPVAVQGELSGDVLQVDILLVQPSV